MQKIEMIVCDLDRTFLKSFFEAQPDNVRAARAARERGVRVCACTARNGDLAARFIRSCGFDDVCAICNGVALYDAPARHVVRTQAFTAEQSRRIVALCVSMKLEFVFYTADHTLYVPGFTPDSFQRAIDAQPQLPAHKQEAFVNCHTVEGLVQLLQQHALLAMVFNRKEQYPDAHVFRALEELGIATVSAPDPGEFNLMPRGVDKGTGLSMLAAHYGIAPETILALGDNANDLPMLRAAGIGVAMGDGDAQLQRAADYVSCGYAQGGVAQAIRRFVLDA